MKETLQIVVVLACISSFLEVEGTSCQDVDHSACVAMAAQNPNMCSDKTLATSVCPQYCSNCPMVCYNCHATAKNISQCNAITCGQGEKCMVRTKDVTNGEQIYSMICGPKVVCADIRKRRTSAELSVHERNLRLICCDQDLCNVPSLISPTTITTTTTTTTIKPTTHPITTQMHHFGCVKDIVVMIEDTLQLLLFYHEIKNEMKSLVYQLDIGPASTRVAFGKFFGNKAETVWDLDSHDHKDSLISAIDQLNPTHLALNAYNIMAANHATNSFTRGNRPSVPDILIILSQAPHAMDGVSYYHATHQSYARTISRMHNRYPDVIALAAGSADVAEMRHMATDSSHYFYIATTKVGLGASETARRVNAVKALICRG